MLAVTWVFVYNLDRILKHTFKICYKREREKKKKIVNKTRKSSQQDTESSQQDSKNSLLDSKNG